MGTPALNPFEYALQRFEETIRSLKPGQRIEVNVLESDGSKSLSPKSLFTLGEKEIRGIALRIDPKYGDQDADTVIFLKHFRENLGARVIEIGSAEEYSANILTDNGYRVVGVDLRNIEGPIKPNYVRLEMDFLDLHLDYAGQDAIYSTSAIEHFGLNTYSEGFTDLNYDVKACGKVYLLLKKGGHFYVTVPYGKNYRCNIPHWRVYNKETFLERIVQGNEIVEKVFFKSSWAKCPDIDGIIQEEDANNYCEEEPHVTIFAKIKKL